MNILSIECSASPVSAAIISDGEVKSSIFSNVKVTHSQTLMPAVLNLLSSALLKFEDIDGIAVAAGPGSFTGIRIGISLAKGLAAPKNLPCVGISTLRGMAQLFADNDCILCPVMDARCSQLYNALFDISGGEIKRICPDRAIMCSELTEELYTFKDRKIIVCGDGTSVLFPYLCGITNVYSASAAMKYQNAVGVGLAAESDFKAGKTVQASELMPIYLRMPQAERELKSRKESE